MLDYFRDFTLATHHVTDGTLRLRIAGSGPPLLLLHGNPQTHAMWHAVAPALAERFTVVAPDLRGYGQSFKPGATGDHAPYAKSSMARDMAELMTGLGHERFQVVAHDRGARVAHRLAIDNPARVERLAVLDIVPTIEHFERADMAFGLGYYHWFWFAQPHPFPEELINAAPGSWFNSHTSREPKPPGFFRQEALEDYLRAAHDPAAITGMCEDYRAAASIDLEHDRISRAESRKVRCDMLVLWGAKGKIGGWYDPLDLWRHYCTGTVRGGPVASGHYLAEEAPDEVLSWLDPFLATAAAEQAA
ncbi:MAG: alpha/beta hydrolase [Acetobacteraceae bacterium]|nr:alpha/beta hydrolase [Acetobacteraceae bacterium]